MSTYIEDTTAQLAKRVADSTERAILEQLNDFISRDLIEIQTTGLRFVELHDPSGGHKIEVRQSVKLVLKDKEYIQKLEHQNQLMQAALRAIVTKSHSWIITEATGGIEKPIHDSYRNIAQAGTP